MLLAFKKFSLFTWNYVQQVFTVKICLFFNEAESHAIYSPLKYIFNISFLQVFQVFHIMQEFQANSYAFYGQSSSSIAFLRLFSALINLTWIVHFIHSVSSLSGQQLKDNPINGRLIYRFSGSKIYSQIKINEFEKFLSSYA